MVRMDALADSADPASPRAGAEGEPTARSMERVAIIGPGGAGKSTLARQLGAALGIDVIHLDALYWQPGWVETPKAAWRERMGELVRAERWILDGNYGGTLDLRLATADTVIFLDLPRRTCLWRVLTRWARFRGRPRPDMAPDCPERVSWDFVKWIWTYPRARRPAVLRVLDEVADRTWVVRLRSPREVRAFVAGVPAATERTAVRPAAPPDPGRA
jgi:adenylate kinase family enzyme